MGSWGRFAGVFALACFSGCSGDTLWLLEVSGLESGVIEPGEPLEFSGHGFPPGRTGDATLTGLLHTAGSEPQPVRWSLRTEARSADRVSAFMDATTSQAIRGHMSFTGSAVFRFAANDTVSVAGRLAPVTIEWAGEDTSDSSLHDSAGRLMQSLGLAVTESMGTKGLRVAQLAPEGIAARTGLQVGELIVAANELPVRSFEDLAQPESAEVLRLRVRDATGTTRDTELRIPRGLGLGAHGLRYLLWACPVALALLFLGPWPAPAELLSSTLRRVHPPRLSLFRVANVSKAATVRMEPVLIASSAVVCSLSAWQAPNLTLTAALALYTALLLLRRADSGMWSDTGLTLAGFNGVLWLALTCVAALSGGSGLATLAADQGAAPWGWNLFSRPPVWLAAFLWVQCAARLHPTAGCSTAHAWFDNLGRVVLAAMTAAVFLGGPSPELSLPAGLELGIRSAVFALKTLLVLWLMAVLAPIAAARARVITGASFALALATASWLWVAPEREVESRVGAAVLATLSLAAVVAAFEHVSRRRRLETT